MSERVVAHYRVETAVDVRWAIDALAREQSSGTFVSVPGETPELIARAGAQVESIEILESVADPSLPDATRISILAQRRLASQSPRSHAHRI